MTQVVSEPIMGKKKGRPSKEKNEVTARIDAEVMRKVKYLASVDKLTIGEYLTRLLQPVVSKKYTERLNRELKEEAEPKS